MVEKTQTSEIKQKRGDAKLTGATLLENLIRIYWGQSKNTVVQLANEVRVVSLSLEFPLHPGNLVLSLILACHIDFPFSSIEAVAPPESIYPLRRFLCPSIPDGQGGSLSPR